VFYLLLLSGFERSKWIFENDGLARMGL
jgi:hypothetical protein